MSPRSSHRRRDARRHVLALCAGSGLVAFTLLLVSAGIALASDCPPGGFTDCAYATQLAVNPLVSIGGTVGGGLLSLVLSGTVGITLSASPQARPADSAEPRRRDVGPSWVIDIFTKPLVRVVENPLGNENRAAHPKLAGASSVVAAVILAIPIGLTAVWGEAEIEARHALHALFGLETERGEP